MIKAQGFVEDHPDEAKKIVANQLGVDQRQLADQWSTTDMEVSLDQELILKLEQIARWAIRGHLIDQTEVPNYLDYIYTDALDKVNPKAITLIR